MIGDLTYMARQKSISGRLAHNWFLPKATDKKDFTFIQSGTIVHWISEMVPLKVYGVNQPRWSRGLRFVYDAKCQLLEMQENITTIIEK